LDSPQFWHETGDDPGTARRRSPFPFAIGGGINTRYSAEAIASRSA